MSRTIQSRLRGAKQTMQAAAVEAKRKRAATKNYDTAWRSLRRAHLLDHPACVVCGAARSDNHVDHVKPHRGDDGLRLNPRNLQTLCRRHHSQKTAREDNGFGNLRK